LPQKPVAQPGYYLFYGSAAYWVPPDSDGATAQPPVDQANGDQWGGDQIDQAGHSQSQRANAVMQQVPDAQSGGEDSYASQTTAEMEPPSPLPDEGEFTLVLNDGTWIQAVAFTRSNDTIVYITTAGSRRTIAASELDSDSTLRVNQERGTPLQSPL
jgi:hypothetical protein